MKLTEAKLKQLIIETMKEGPLGDEDRQFLLNLLRHDELGRRIQGIEFAATMMDKEDWQTAFDNQLLHMNGYMLVNWLSSGDSRGPRRVLDQYMIIPKELKNKQGSKEKRESELKVPFGKEWNRPISEGSEETWKDRLYQMHGGLERVASSGDFYAWEREWSDFKEFLRSFYEIHAPGFWDSLSDEKQMNKVYNKPEAAIEALNEAHRVLDPTWRLAEPLARQLRDHHHRTDLYDDDEEVIDRDLPSR